MNFVFIKCCCIYIFLVVYFGIEKKIFCVFLKFVVNIIEFFFLLSYY